MNQRDKIQAACAAYYRNHASGLDAETEDLVRLLLEIASATKVYVTHDDWLLLGVSDLGKYGDIRYIERGGMLTARQLDERGHLVLNEIHEILGFGKAGTDECYLCQEKL